MVNNFFNLNDIENNFIDTIIEIEIYFRTKIIFTKIEIPNIIGLVDLDTRIIRVDITYRNIDQICTTICHELGHLYCLDNNKFPIYHINNLKLRGDDRDIIIGYKRTMVRAEKYVHDVGEKIFNDHFKVFNFNYIKTEFNEDYYNSLKNYHNF